MLLNNKVAAPLERIKQRSALLGGAHGDSHYREDQQELR